MRPPLPGAVPFESGRKLDRLYQRLDDWVTRLALGTSRIFLRARWLIVILMAVMLFLFEIAEHPNQDWSSPFELLSDELLIFGFAFPLLIGLLLTLLAYTENERVRAVYNLDLQQSFSEQLSALSRLEDLVEQVVSFPRRLLPISMAALHLYNPDYDRFELAGEWSLDGKRRPRLPDTLSPQDFPTEPSSEALSGLFPCSYLEEAGQFPPVQAYYVPLNYQDQTVAILHIVLPIEATLPTNRVKALMGSTAEMAMAISSLRFQKTAVSQAEAADSQRKRIAQNLHDTLGQNVSYLRLKLDQLSGDDALWEISSIRQELERMRDIADDAYNQVRASLEELQPANSGDLCNSMLQHARSVAARANFKIRFQPSGTPVELPPHIKRQILFICREALNNIEKHACAHEVTYTVCWSPEQVEVTISDDGLGFDRNKLDLTGHYGLQIMQERAADIQAEMNIISKPGRGTHITVRVPLKKGAEPISSYEYLCSPGR